MSIQKILEMADRFIALAEKDEGTTIKTPHNLEYQDQRTRLAEFYDNFKSQLRRIIGEMGSDLFTLKERGFDAKMFKLFANAYQDIIGISKEAKEDRPYIAAEKLAHYVLEKPNSSVLENLDFLAKHHIQSTNVDFLPGKRLQHPKVHSIDELRRFAIHLRKFMAENPLIQPPGISSLPPPIGPMGNIMEMPAFFAGQEDATNPGSPLAKKK